MQTSERIRVDVKLTDADRSQILFYFKWRELSEQDPDYMMM